jgi:hypothetical protein
VMAVTRALKKHGVAHRASGTEHVVVVTQPGFLELYLSLKSKRDSSLCNLLVVDVPKLTLPQMI